MIYFCILHYFCYTCSTLHINIAQTSPSASFRKVPFPKQSPVKSHQAITLNPLGLVHLIQLHSRRLLRSRETNTPTEGLRSLTQGLLSVLNEKSAILLRTLKVSGDMGKPVTMLSLCQCKLIYLRFYYSHWLTQASTNGVHQTDTFLWVTCCGNKASGI